MDALVSTSHAIDGHMLKAELTGFLPHMSDRAFEPIEDAPPLTYTRSVRGFTGRIDTRPSSILGSTRP